MTAKDSAQDAIESTDREQDAATPLREGREAAGLSIDEVATQLNLGVATIEALEAGAYERLPPPAFVRGYLRGYARLLHLDADQLLRRYDARRPSEPSISSVSRVVSQPGSGHPLMRWATVLIVVALGGMAAVWWQREYRESPPTLSSGALEPPAATAPPPLPQAVGPEIAERRDAPVAMVPPEEPAVLPTPGAAVVAEQPASLEEAPAAADAGTVRAEEPAAGPETSADADTESVASEPPAPATEAVTAGDVLIVQARGESWMEVTDADEQRLYFDLLRPGAPMRLQGRAPFQIFLGNAPVVDLQINGLEIDKSGFTRSNNTARFVVGPDGVRRR